MPMPEAAMNENHGLVLGQHHVRPARQLSSVQAKAVAQPVHQRSNNDFRLGVLAPDTTHVPASALFAQPVSHTNVFPDTTLCAQDELPHSSQKWARIASKTSGRTGVVALWSR
jgi:hypothetical protein